MEYSNYHEESTNSSEVDDEEKKVDLGVGRSYECVFCKRGFNTAQALGGHMNIHRKDRSSSAAARNNKPKQTNTTRFSSSNLLGQLRCFSPPHQPHLTYSTYFPPASSTTTNDSDRHLSDPDWRMRLINVDNNRHLQEKELDLELRLGYH